jgi:hypothetical protein
MRFLRTTTRGLLVAVAATGLLLGVGVHLQRWHLRFTKLAIEHAQEARAIRLVGLMEQLSVASHNFCQNGCHQLC